MGIINPWFIYVDALLCCLPNWKIVLQREKDSQINQKHTENGNFGLYLN